jgi:hypothetical protein
MAFERRDPVPAGTYSVFVLESELPKWQAWVTANIATVHVRGAISQRVAPNGLPVFAVDTDFNIIWTRIGTAFFFDITAPTPWVGLGLPDIETRSIDAWRREKTENPEYIPDPADKDPFNEVKSLVLFVSLVYLGGALLQRGRRS